MSGVVLQQFDAFGESQTRIQPLCVAERGPHTANIEKVLCRGTNQDGRRGAHHQIIRVIHAEGDLAVNVLLRILGADGIQ